MRPPVLLPTKDCLHRRTELFLAGTVPTEHCTLHQRVRIDRDTAELATANCPPDRVIERVFTVLPAEGQEWARERHWPQPPTQMCELHPDGSELATTTGAGPERPRAISPQGAFAGPEEGLVLTSPDQGSTYRLSPQIPAADQCIDVAARPGDGVRLRSVTLFVDGIILTDRVGAQGALYRQLWCLQKGEHQFQARGVDETGQPLASRVVHIDVQGE